MAYVKVEIPDGLKCEKSVGECPRKKCVFLDNGRCIRLDRWLGWTFLQDMRVFEKCHECLIDCGWKLVPPEDARDIRG
jgi:hypothetical protein